MPYAVLSAVTLPAIFSATGNTIAGRLRGGDGRGAAGTLAAGGRGVRMHRRAAR